MLQVVERAFKSVKDVMEIRPVFHWKESGIKEKNFECLCSVVTKIQNIISIHENFQKFKSKFGLESEFVLNPVAGQPVQFFFEGVKKRK